MAKEKSADSASGRGPTRSGRDSSAADSPVLAEFMRRAMALGLSGFFTTEEAIRKALGDTLPKDWVDFASQQSERTRAELLDRFSAEFGRVMENIDPAELLGQLLEGQTIEVKAEVRLAPSEGAKAKTESSLKVKAKAQTESNLKVAGTRKKDSP